MKRIHISRMVGIGLILFFVFLLTVRLGVFEEKDGKRVDLEFLSQVSADHETWMVIFQKDQRVGHVRRQFSRIGKGYRLIETVFMRINTMGMVQDIRYRLIGEMDQNLLLSTFDFELQSNLFRFQVRGGLQGKTLLLYSGPTGSEEKFEIPVPEEIFLPAGVLASLANKELKKGDLLTFHVFDPITMAQREMRVKIISEETLWVMGREERAKKVSVDFMGIPQTAWIGMDGTLLKEEGAFGLRLERTTQQDALKEVEFSSIPDMIEGASLSVPQPLPNPHELKELKIKLEGVRPEGLWLDGGRQSFKNNILMVRKESIAHLSAQQKRDFEGQWRRYLEATPFIQSNHPEIHARAKEIVSEGDSDGVKATKLLKWVYQNIQKRPVLSVPNALETLRNRVGDCNEHAVLLAALARAVGIPAEIEAGLVYQKGKFYYHAWNSLFLGEWITADAAMGQFPADVTHLRFVRGTEQQIDLMRIVGKVRLEVLSAS